jgi:hypothetical protein
MPVTRGYQRTCLKRTATSQTVLLGRVQNFLLEGRLQVLQEPEHRRRRNLHVDLGEAGLKLQSASAISGNDATTMKCKGFSQAYFHKFVT